MTHSWTVSRLPRSLYTTGLASIMIAAMSGCSFMGQASSPTPTPHVVTHVHVNVYVTAQPQSTSNVPAHVAARPSATPSRRVGVVTPLPGATPIDTEVGLHLGMITQPQWEVDYVQAEADKENPAFTYFRDPRLVVEYNLPAYGFTQGFIIASPAPSPTPTPAKEQDGRPVIRFIVSYQGHHYTVAVAQSSTHGPKGTWLIVSILPGV